jgi:hypothetical protein
MGGRTATEKNQGYQGQYEVFLRAVSHGRSPLSSQLKKRHLLFNRPFLFQVKGMHPP